MAQGTILSDKSRDGIAALVWRNMGDLEESMWELQYEWDQREATFDGMQAAMEQAGLRVLNGPNMIKQPQYTTRNYPSSAVITETLTVPVEDATAAAETLTYTITNEAITSSYVLHQVKSSNYDVVSWSSVTGTAAAGSMTITVAARSGAHNAAVTLTVYLCTVSSVSVPYGETAHSWATNQPYIDSINNNSDYAGQEEDEIAETVVTLTGANIVTDINGDTFDKAIQFVVTNPPSNGWGNADKLIWNYGNHYIEMENGQPKYQRYGEIEEMIVGEVYTMSCWARITNGTKALLWLGVDPYNGHYITKYTDGYEYHEIEAKNGAWQRVSFQFTFNPSGDRFYTFTNNDGTFQSSNWCKQVGFGVCRKYASTVQLCGFRLVRGKLFVCETYDDLEEDLFTQKGRITTLESKSTSILADIADSETATATAAHAVGDLITVGNQLYKVTAAIAIGDTITATGNGANVTATTLEALIAEKAATANPAFTGTLTLGSTELSEAALQNLLSLTSANGLSF